MAKRINWNREELIVAFNLYCKMPFSKINYRHPLIIKLADAIGRTPSAVAWKLVNFASIDPSLQKRGIVGAKNIGKQDKIIFEEFASNWNDLAYESELLYSKYFQESIEIDDKDDIFEIKEGKVKEALVKVRVNQSFFRKAVLSSYENKCCITDISIPDLLIASHIVPWSKDEKNRLNPQNGICLNSIHDKAFDKGYITIDFDFRVVISKKIEDYKEDINIQRFFYDFEGKNINLPKRFIPDENFLKYHHDVIFKK